MKQAKPMAVLFPASTRRRLARISKKAGLSQATIIRHAVKKQLPLWETNFHEAEVLAPRVIRKSGKNAPLTPKKTIAQKHNQPKL